MTGTPATKRRAVRSMTQTDRWTMDIKVTGRPRTADCKASLDRLEKVLNLADGLFRGGPVSLNAVLKEPLSIMLAVE